MGRGRSRGQEDFFRMVLVSARLSPSTIHRSTAFPLTTAVGFDLTVCMVRAPIVWDYDKPTLWGP